MSTDRTIQLWHSGVASWYQVVIGTVSAADGCIPLTAISIRILSTRRPFAGAWFTTAIVE